jgi:hypothetical protein
MKRPLNALELSVKMMTDIRRVVTENMKNDEKRRKETKNLTDLSPSCQYFDRFFGRIVFEGRKTVSIGGIGIYSKTKSPLYTTTTLDNAIICQSVSKSNIMYLKNLPKG